MKVILFGKNGQVGWELSRSIPKGSNLIAYDSSSLDITNEDAIKKAFDDFKPDVVVNAAAYTAVDNAEKERELAFQVNAEAAGNIAKLCENYDIHLIHISTDFVFSGKQSIPYKTSDDPVPLNVYGASKLKGEHLVLTNTNNRALIIRTAWVYSIHGNNFVKTMIRLMGEKSELKVVSDQIGCPTYAVGLAEIIWNMAGKKLNGIYHWTDAGVASWYDFAVAIYEEAIQIGLLDSDVKIIPINTDEYPTLANRPFYSVLDKKQTWNELKVKPIHWRQCLRNMLREYKSN